MRRVVKVKIGIVVFVLLYFGAYELWWNRKYQKICPLHSNVRPKVSGVTKLDSFTDEELHVPNPEAYRDIKFRDSVDLVEYLGVRQVFVMTNYILTSNQTVGNCSESLAVNGANCTEDKDCPVDKPLTSYGYGIATGKCIPNAVDPKRKTCEVTAWCPTENWQLPFKEKKAMFDVRDFVIMPKVFVEVRDCGSSVAGRNMWKQHTNRYIQDCIFDPIKNPYCPNIRLSDVISGAGYKYDDVSITGAIFQIKIDWGSVSLDWNYNLRDYMPTYSFSRVDTLRSTGYNFKTAIYNYEGLNNRTQLHRFGLTFATVVEGEGRKFDLFVIVMAVGSISGLIQSMFLALSVIPTIAEYVKWKWVHKLANCVSVDEMAQPLTGRTVEVN